MKKFRGQEEKVKGQEENGVRWRRSLDQVVKVRGQEEKVRGQEKVRRSGREGLGVKRRKSRSGEKVWESGGGHRVRRRSGIRGKRSGSQKVKSQEEKVRESRSEVGGDIQEEKTGGKN